MNNSCIYANPYVPGTIYPFAMVTHIDWRDEGHWFPKLMIRLRIIPLQPDIDPSLGGRHFNSIIHPVESAKHFYENFAKSFKAPTNQYDKAIGNIAMIRLEPSAYNGTKYSSVWFVYQKFPVVLQSRRYMDYYYLHDSYPPWDARSWDQAPDGWAGED